jgi:hypothetical protein
MAFDRDKVSELLSKCHRRCCICHRFCGVKMETDHMKPHEEGGSDDIENAIPLCFECHAEVHAYNVKHPRGRKYTENELKEHKQQWLKICKDHPETLVDNPRMADPGPLSSLFTELEYNQKVSDDSEGTDGLLYRTSQFERAVSEGILSLIDEELKNKIMDAYIKMSQSNQFTQFLGSYVKTGDSREAKNNASRAHRNAKSAINEAHSKLEKFLSFT